MAYAGQEGSNQKCARKNKCDYGRGDECFCAVCVEVLRPHGEPPWVGSLLLVEDIEGVCAGAEDTNAEHNDKTCDNGLCKVERRWVDLHAGGLTGCWK